MSQPLQRVVVRMLYDPAFVLAVYDDPLAATADVDLSDVQRSWLVQPDKRAWTIDRERRARALAALIDEYPATTRLVDAVDAFFSSATFHGCIQSRGSLALAYGDFLAEHFAARAWVPTIARLEQTVARLRRAVAPQVLIGRVGLNHRVAPMVATAGVTAAYQKALHKGGVPRHQPAETEELLAELRPDGSIDLSGASPELVRLLEAARPVVARAALEGVARELGCDASEARELVTELAAEGLLVLGS